MLILGAKRKVGKKKSGATEWRALLQFALNAIEVYNVTRELPPHELRILQMVAAQLVDLLSSWLLRSSLLV